MQTSQRRSDKFRKADIGPIHLTLEGHERLKAELAELKRVLPAYIAETQRTAAYGDRSDNAEYKQAKATLRRTNYRILEVEDQLKRIYIISTDQKGVETVRLGVTVVLELKNGIQKTFQILGSAETNPEKGLISFQSPLGTALMGRCKNDRITTETPAGSQEYLILEIK